MDYLVFHGYDANDKGKPKLRIEKLNGLMGGQLLRKLISKGFLAKFFCFKRINVVNNWLISL